MENTQPQITSDLLDSVRRQQAQRLLDLAEALIQSFEGMDMPKDTAELNRACRALLSLDKLVSNLHEHAKHIEDDPESPEPKTPQQRQTELKAYQTAQGHRLQTLNINRTAPAPQPQPPAKSLPPFKATPRNGFRR